MVDYDEPVKDYETYFKEHHARTVSEFFEDLVRTSGVNEQENIALVTEIKDLETSKSSKASTRKGWKAGRIASIIVAIGLAILAFSLGDWNYLWLLPAVGLIVLVFAKFNPEIKKLDDIVAQLDAEITEKKDVAWSQMAPLNALHSWDVARKLFQSTFPTAALDAYFANGRHDDLTENYDLSDDFMNGRSALFSQGGSIGGNPFVISRYIQHWMGVMSYSGSIIIYWTEYVRDSDGNQRAVQRSQTLTATVTKPYPMFTPHTALIYGHEAAPNLSFSRQPSSLSDLDDGAFNNWRKEKAVKKVEKMARKAVKSGNSGITAMANREFEALFNAVDRDNEIEFRLLFTPLAQQEMVNLMKDKDVAYGDDFAFSKYGKLNVVEPRHLGSTALDNSPRNFVSYDIEEARATFNNLHNAYFKSIYFGLAPLLTVPLYRENRSLPALKTNKDSENLSPWEHEAMANVIGGAAFAHPDSITENLLKTSRISHSNGVDTVSVTAYGYAGFPRVDIVPMLGGDGNWHEVPVNWTEYIQVERESQFYVGVTSSEDTPVDMAGFQKQGISAENVYVRGPLGAALPGA